MALRKTPLFGLHLFDHEGAVQRYELNENFEAIEEAIETKTRLVTGMYTGDGSSTRFIDLGVTPRAVFVLHEGSYLKHDSYYYGGLAIEGSPAFSFYGNLVEIAEGGFQVYNVPKSYSGNYINKLDEPYLYIALL